MNTIIRSSQHGVRVLGEKLVHQTLPDGEDSFAFLHTGFQNGLDNLLHPLLGLIAGDGGGDDTIAFRTDDAYSVVFGIVVVLELDVEGVSGCIVARRELGDGVALAHRWYMKMSHPR